IQAPDKGWLSPQTLLAFGVALVVLVAFVFWERAREEPMLDISYFKNPAFSTGTGGMILVFLSLYGVLFLITQYFQLILGYSPLSAALRFLPMAPILMVVSPLTPRITARLGANRTVAAGMALVAIGFLAFARLDVDTSYAYVLLCVFFLVSGIAMTMSPMTAAIMSAVPPRRAGAGSAMNDATRELGAALGVAVLGSVAASRFGSGIASIVGSLPAADRAEARTSLAGALRTAKNLPQGAAARLVSGADHAFVSGIHFAAITGAILAAAAALIVLRFLPRHIAQHGAAKGAVEAMEDAAELGLAGIPPVFADTGQGPT
nr:MFS transporter [Actinomycetota bacterium]